jgi:putative oxidoreductase
MESLLQYSDTGLLLLRIAIGVIFVYHSRHKITKPRDLSGGMGMPANAVLLIGLIEALSGLGIALGVYTQLSALLIMLIMVGATYKKIFTWKVPFYAHDKTGWEFDFILFFAALAILLTGGGSFGL